MSAPRPWAGRRSWWLLAFAAMAALQAWTVFRMPIATKGDEGLHILLSKSLAGGAFALPDAHGQAMNDPLPGFAAAMLLPIRLAEPHWILARLFVLSVSWALLYFVWKLARKALPWPWAAAAALLTGLNPVMVDHIGLVMPDAWAALGPAACILLLGDRPTWASSTRAGLAAAALAMLRPQGALLAGALAVATGANSGAAMGVCQLALSLAPLGAWSLRNKLLAGAGSGYLTNWTAQIGSLENPGGQAVHGLQVLATFFGRAMVPFADSAPAAGALAAALVFGLACWGAVKLVRSGRVWALAASMFAGFVLCLHLTWSAAVPRYALPLVPLVWIFVLYAVQDSWAEAGRAWPALALTAALSAGQAVSAEASAWSGGFPLPATLQWIRTHVPPDAAIQSVSWNILTLGTGRKTFPIPVECAYRDKWLASLAEHDVDYVMLTAVNSDGLFTPQMAYVVTHLGRWARSTPMLEQVYRNMDEKTSVYKVDRAEAARFKKAWTLFSDATAEWWQGRRDLARLGLRKAVGAYPGLAVGWTTLGELQAEPGEALELFETAAAADPTSESIAAELDAARRRARDSGS